MILSSFLALALASVAAADSIHIPLRRTNNPLLKRDGSIDTDKVAEAGLRLRHRYGWHKEPTKMKRQGQTVAVPVINQVYPPSISLSVIRECGGGASRSSCSPSSFLGAQQPALTEMPLLSRKQILHISARSPSARQAKTSM